MQKLYNRSRKIFKEQEKKDYEIADVRDLTFNKKYVIILKKEMRDLTFNKKYVIILKKDCGTAASFPQQAFLACIFKIDEYCIVFYI